MTKENYTPEEKLILQRATRADGTIEGTSELVLDQARSLGLIPWPDEDQISESKGKLKPVSKEELEEFYEDFYQRAIADMLRDFD